MRKMLIVLSVASLGAALPVYAQDAMTSQDQLQSHDQTGTQDGMHSGDGMSGDTVKRPAVDRAMSQDGHAMQAPSDEMQQGDGMMSTGN